MTMMILIMTIIIMIFLKQARKVELIQDWEKFIGRGTRATETGDLNTFSIFKMTFDITMLSDHYLIISWLWFDDYICNCNWSWYFMVSRYPSWKSKTEALNEDQSREVHPAWPAEGNLIIIIRIIIVVVRERVKKRPPSKVGYKRSVFKSFVNFW